MLCVLIFVLVFSMLVVFCLLMRAQDVCAIWCKFVPCVSLCARVWVRFIVVLCALLYVRSTCVRYCVIFVICVSFSVVGFRFFVADCDNAAIVHMVLLCCGISYCVCPSFPMSLFDACIPVFSHVCCLVNAVCLCLLLFKTVPPYYCALCIILHVLCKLCVLWRTCVLSLCLSVLLCVLCLAFVLYNSVVS